MILIYQVLLTLLSLSSPLLAQTQTDSQYNPPKDYEECRVSALRIYRNNLNKEKFQQRLDICFHRFPGSEEYLACKRKAIRKDKSGKGLRACRSILEKLNFQISSPFPVANHRNNFYFAGTSLNTSKHLDQFSPLHFDCSHLQKALQTGEGIRWSAPSTSLSDLKGLEKLGIRQQIRALGIQKLTGRDGVQVSGLGRLRGSIRKKSSDLYFPTSICTYRNDDPGSFYANLSTRYLLNAESSTVTPLSGHATYASETIPMKEIQNNLRDNLPASLKSFPTKYGFYFSTEKFKKFDQEHYPVRPCSQKTPQAWIVQVFRNKVKTSFTESVRITNLKNFCTYANQRIQPWIGTPKP